MTVKGIVDLHSHILPNADHGSSSVETSLFQLKSAKENGVERIFATPHFYPNIHTVEGFISKRNNAYLNLVSHLDGLPEIKLGAEVLICNKIEKLPSLEKLFIAGTNVLLLELPFSYFDKSFVKSVKALVGNGVNVVLVHPDRYAFENVKSLIDVGARLQINASSIVTFTKNKHIFDWLDADLVLGLGSDIHERDKKAFSDLARAFDKISGRYDYVLKRSVDLWENSEKLQIEVG